MLVSQSLSLKERLKSLIDLDIISNINRVYYKLHIIYFFLLFMICYLSFKKRFWPIKLRNHNYLKCNLLKLICKLLACPRVCSDFSIIALIFQIIYFIIM